VPKFAWYRDLTRYQWFALTVCCLGWMFDAKCAREPGIVQINPRRKPIPWRRCASLAG
jgi:hypothetical protein